MDSVLARLVDEWLRLDKNEVTRAEIEALVKDGNITELDKRMRKRIEFGTAGLRGRMEAGWSRMNDLIVIQASQGLCAYMLEHIHNAALRGVVIGHDHRHNSERWARLTAAAFIARNVKVYLHEGLVHTPLVPFSVKKLDAACGVMITASHNPKNDNGYKVYWENAVQIISPHDAGISDSIEANLEPKCWETENLHSSDIYCDVTAEMINAYFKYIESLRACPVHMQTELKFVNTSLHGVSHPFVSRASRIFGFPSFVSVVEQEHPDPDFPTVRFPNPEEKGALDLAMRKANEENAQYILAQDPDADRFSAAERLPDGRWMMFTGDQLGTLFADSILRKYKATKNDLSKLAMVASTVSSKMVEYMAEKEGFKFVECLTGFKYIGNTALNLQRDGYDVPFGYEEAIGYMFGSDIRDKDGVAATVLFAELVTNLHLTGKTASSRLEELYQRYGFFETSNGYFICEDSSIIGEIFDLIRNFHSKGPKDYPKEIAGLKITRIVDLTIGYDSGNPPHYIPKLPLSSGHMIQVRAESSSVKITLTLRTSGTEPKIKYYLEGSGKTVSIVREALPRVIAEIGKSWLQADKYSLLHS